MSLLACFKIMARDGRPDGLRCNRCGLLVSISGRPNSGLHCILPADRDIGRSYRALMSSRRKTATADTAGHWEWQVAAHELGSLTFGCGGLAAGVLATGRP